MDIVRAPRGYKNYIVIYSYIIHTYVYIYIHMRSQCSDSQVIFPCEFALMLISDYSQKGWSSFPAILKDHKTSNLSDETSITWTENHHSHIFPIYFPYISHDIHIWITRAIPIGFPFTRTFTVVKLLPRKAMTSSMTWPGLFGQVITTVELGGFLTKKDVDLNVKNRDCYKP